MGQGTALFMVAAMLAGAGQPPAVDREQLRQAVAMPSVSVLFGYGVKNGRFVAGNGKGGLPREIAALEKKLAGDATDAARYRQLAPLYAEAGAKEKFTAATNRAAAMLRIQFEAAPQDPWAMAQYGAILHYAGKVKEGEQLLRRAVQLAPDDWRCWVELGKILPCKANQVFLEKIKVDFEQLNGECKAKNQDLNDAYKAMWKTEQAAEKFRRFQENMAEAGKCVDQAVAVGPQKGAVHAERFHSRYSCALFTMMYGGFQNAKVTNPMAVMLSPEGRDDVYRYLLGNPDDSNALGFYYYVEFMATLLEHKGPPDAKLQITPELFPEAVRPRVAWAEEQLRRLAKSPDKVQAAAALEALTFIEVSADRKNPVIETRLRQVLELDPQRLTAWDYLAAFLNKENKLAEGLTVCRDRLKLEDTASTRYQVARSYELTGDYAKAEEWVLLALKADPDNFHATVGLAALELRQAGDDAGKLAEVRTLLDRGGKWLKDNESKEMLAVQSGRPSWCLVQGIYLALAGDVNGARQLLLEVLMADRDSKMASAALRALK